VTITAGSPPAPLSCGQERMWLAARLAPESGVNEVAVSYDLRGPLDRAALDRAVATVHRRHEVLRTVIGRSGGTQVQVVVPAAERPLRYEDLTAAPEPEQEAARLARQWGTQPYRLDRELPVRWRLVRLGEDHHMLTISVHHIAFDGWSEALVQRELSALYAAYHAGEPDPLPRLSTQYGDYATWQRQRLASGELDADRAFWHDRLAGAPDATRLPFDRAADVDTGPAAQTFTAEIPPALVTRITTLAHTERASPFMVLLAAFAHVLGEAGDQTDVVVGVPVAGRPRPALEQLIGFFVNTVAIRVDLSQSPSFRALLRRVRDDTLDALTHQELPFEQAVIESGVRRVPGREPLVQVMFQVYDSPEDALRLPGLEVRRQYLLDEASSLDLSVSVVLTGEAVRGYWTYRTGLFDRSTVEAIQARFARVLDSMTGQPDADRAAHHLARGTSRSS
jgi:Condensation domain